MNGPHDLGGQHGFGPIAPETDEPLFHADWERRAFALVLAMGGTGAWNIDTSRHARERIPPAEYLSLSYYQIWLNGMERLLVEKGLATEAELRAGRAEHPGAPLPRVPTRDTIPAMLAKSGPADRPAAASARFGPGDAVRAKTINPQGHTRLPRYVRGRVGRIERVHGTHVFPDTNAAGQGENPCWLYSVGFAAREVWGEGASQGDEVLLDLWEPYLEPA